MLDQERLAFIAIGIWEMSWKGIAMWKAAQKKELRWYIAIFIINSFGLLSIFYIYKEKILKHIPFFNLLKKKS